jgi:hypothetical protein
VRLQDELFNLVRRRLTILQICAVECQASYIEQRHDDFALRGAKHAREFRDRIEH